MDTELQGTVLALLSLQIALLGRLLDRGLLARSDVEEIIGMCRRSVESHDEIGLAQDQALENIGASLLRG